MKIAFVTTQNLQGSTVAGRVLPLAEEISKFFDVHVLVHKSPIIQRIGLSQNNIHVVGKDPFIKTGRGKIRMRGFSLMRRMQINALRTFFTLIWIKPDVIVIVKPLPQNVLAVWRYSFFRKPKSIILDVDDFELEAQQLSSIIQRAIVHWSERKAVQLSRAVIVATPFLHDHFLQLSKNKETFMIPTGINPIRIEHNGNNHTMIYAGSISISSGHRVDLLPCIVEQVRKNIPDAKLIMAGSGDDIQKLKGMFQSKGLQGEVEWTGRFDEKDLLNLLKKSSIIVDPIDSSVANRAKSSFRSALAASVGFPIVTSDIGIRPKHFPGSLHEKFFARPEDADDYARHIVSIFQCPLSYGERNRMQKHAEKYTWEVLAKNYMTVISKYLK